MNADVHTLTGAYALDALSQLERRKFEEHLTVCPACAQEVAELRETAVRLGSAVATPPPSALKRNVLAAVTHTRQLPPSGGSTIVDGRGAGRGWPKWVAAAAVAASLVLAAVLGIQTALRLDESRRAQAELDQLKDALGTPDASVVSAPADGGGAGTAVVARSTDSVMFVPRDLPGLPSDRTYQLWLIDGTVPRSAGLIDPTKPILAGNLGAATKIALTVEPEGGSPGPTTAPILRIEIPA